MKSSLIGYRCIADIEEPGVAAALNKELICLPDAGQVGGRGNMWHGCFADESCLHIATDERQISLNNERAQRAVGKLSDRASLQWAAPLGNERGQRRMPESRYSVLVRRDPEQASCVPCEWDDRASVA